MSFLTSIVIYTPFWNQDYPPRLLGGCSGDSNENVRQCTYRSEILHRTSLIFIFVIPDNQSHQDSNQVSRIFSKTPWRKIWILIEEWTKSSDILHRASLMFIHIIPYVQSHLDSIQESRMSSKSLWLMSWRLIGDSSLPFWLVNTIEELTS